MKGFAAKRAGREGFAAVGHSDAALAGLGLDAVPIIQCEPNPLIAAEASLRRLDRDVSEQELDLFQFAAVLSCSCIVGYPENESAMPISGSRVSRPKLPERDFWPNS